MQLSKIVSSFFRGLHNLITGGPVPSGKICDRCKCEPATETMGRKYHVCAICEFEIRTY